MNEELVRMEHIEMVFPGVHALKDVSIIMKTGEIHAIMGENGAGKSTLIKILTGVYKKISGSIIFAGSEFNPSTPLVAQHAGIQTVYQEINLCDNLTVAENIFIGRHPTNFKKIEWKTIENRAVAALKRLNVTLDVNKLLSVYSVAIKQMVAIARAVSMSSRVLILDEPTSSLDAKEVKELFSILRQLKAEGMTIIFISHFLDQVFEISDRISILRNGNMIGTFPTKDLTPIDLVSKMVGKEYSDLKQREKTKKNHDSLKPILEMRSTGKKREIDPFNIKLFPGEILGFAGLLGSGRTEAASLMFGIKEIDQGEIVLRGKKKVVFRNPSDAIAQHLAFCPEDRKADGVFYDLSVKENIIIALQARDGLFRNIPKKAQEEIAKKYIEMLGIATPDVNQSVGNLSGGNQQKVILARWLVTDPHLLILDEPTRGIDVKAKAEIMNLAMSMCEKGMSILFISSEMDEVIRCSDRIAILRDRKMITEFEGAEVTETRILQSIAGGLHE